MNPQTLHASLELHEGRKRNLYRDTSGHWTGGVGHNFDEPMEDELIDLILDYDIRRSIRELDRAFKGWREHDDVRQNVLVELQFNMGAVVLGRFKQFWAALQAKDYATAADELLDSAWAGQVGDRATVLAGRIRSGIQ